MTLFDNIINDQTVTIHCHAANQTSQHAVPSMLQLHMTTSDWLALQKETRSLVVRQAGWKDNAAIHSNINVILVCLVIPSRVL